MNGFNNGDKVDIVMRNGETLEGWYVYDAKCGYLTKWPDSQIAGMIYFENTFSVHPAQ